ncbi:MAG TPA: M1 family aminopeptidase, partial [Symbiobacteriaceae bacterium]|nr:M1 family aminopeptidase [Symbiobacteriaceae bacterium]
AETIARETARAMEVLEAQFGPYPYTDLTVVSCCAWLEYPGLFYTQEPYVEAPWQRILYHELAHQWFYGAVGNDQYTEAWLDEGFARYGERYLLRAFGYTDQLRDLLEKPAPDVPVNSSSDAFHVVGGYSAVVYDRGALVLEDLEQLVGAEAFRRILQEYVNRYRFKTATTADFVRVAGEVSGRDLTGFFREHGVEPQLREKPRVVIPLGQVKPW